MSIEVVSIVGSLIIGAGGLIFGIYQFVDKKKSSKVKLKVTINMGMLTYTSGHLSEAMIFLNVANIGNKAVTINAPNIKIKRPKGGSLLTDFGYYQPFPHKLEPGESTVAWQEIKPLARALKESGLKGKVPLEGYFTTQVGDTYKAKKEYHLDVDEWGK